MAWHWAQVPWTSCIHVPLPFNYQSRPMWWRFIWRAGYFNTELYGFAQDSLDLVLGSTAKLSVFLSRQEGPGQHGSAAA